MQAYLPDAGFEYVVTHRYRTARLQRLQFLDTMSDEARFSAHLIPGRSDLCVMAVRSFEPDDIITYCTAALKDLTHQEDQALREEAAEVREADLRDGHLRPQRDFSIIRSSRRKCSQLLLGPARFINHDCRPNAEFRRSGHILTIRCIRPIQCNEEITTYYGDNYFEWQNKECMCATCERLGQGFYAQLRPALPKPAADLEARRDTNECQDVPHHEDARRMLRSASARTAAAKESVSTSAQTIAFQVDPDASGPVCECATCHAQFRAPEKWWTPDECARCERHYKLFKCDWPHRKPKENPAEQTSSSRAPKRSSKLVDKPPRLPKKARHTSNAQLSSSPVKLSPVHEKPLESSSESDSLSTASSPSSRHDLSTDQDQAHRIPTPPAPRILGHGASTDVLAAYWGAPEGERKRRRRPTNMSLTLLSNRAVLDESKQPLSSSHSSRKTRSQDPSPYDKRTAHVPPVSRSKCKSSLPSSLQTATSPNGGFESKYMPNVPLQCSRNMMECSEAEAQVQDMRTAAGQGPERKSVSVHEHEHEPVGKCESKPLVKQRANAGLERASGSESNSASASKCTLECNDVTKSQSKSSVHQHNTTSDNASDPGQRKSGPKIATQGPERTSVLNLALFWSGGVEGRTRRQARQAHLCRRTPPPSPDSPQACTDAPMSSASTPYQIKQESCPATPEPPAPCLQRSPEETLSYPSTHAPSLIHSNCQPTVVPPGAPVRQPVRRNLRWGSGKTSTSRPPTQAAPLRVAWPSLMKAEPSGPITSASQHTS